MFLIKEFQMTKKWTFWFLVGMVYFITLFFLNRVTGLVPVLEVGLFLAWFVSVPASVALAIKTSFGFGRKAFRRPSTVIPGLEVFEAACRPSVLGAAATGFVVAFILLICITMAKALS